jgi:DNA-binding LacI/PurR family transcriptional regulator
MPDPVGLLGMNCTDWTNLTTPSVSTIVEPVAGEGRQACRIILDLIHGTHEEDHHCALDCDTNWMGTTLSTTT